MDYGPLLGGSAGRGTIGGVLAANLSGPRRIKAGAARDHFLGFTAVSGRGETFKSGGRVVKNVTGYDLCKLLAGSWGTLAAMTDVTIKVLPRAETEADRAGARPRRRARPRGDGGGDGLVLRRVGRGASAGAASRDAFRRSWHGDQAATALRLEGVAPSVAHRKRRADERCCEPFGALRVARRDGFARALAAIRDVRAVLRERPIGDRPLWRISIAPARGRRGRGARSRPARRCFYDWAGGLVWVALPPSDDAGAARDRAAPRPRPAAMRRWSARRPRCAPRRRCSSRRSGALAALTQRVKESFDPQGHPQSRPDVGGRVDADHLHPRAARRSATSRKPTRSCAPACIAASAPRPARPMCCSATSSIRRAGAST